MLGEREIRLETQGFDEKTLKSSFKCTDVRSEMRKTALGRSQTPQERRQKESESHIFPTDENKPSKRIPKTPEPKENVYSRATDHNFSDLFGREFTHKKEKPAPVPHRECAKPRYTPVLQSRTPTRLPSAKAMKLYNITKVATTRPVPAPREARLDTYTVKGLRAGADETTVKRLCTGLHIVAVDTDMDDITGKCKGNAKLTLRHFPGSDSESHLNLSLASAGLEVTPCKPKFTRVNHYDALSGRSFLDCHSQREEKRLAGRALTPILSKMRLLESSDDLYGSSPGVGRWSKQWKQRPVLDLSLDLSLAQLHQWERMGRAKTPT